MEVLSSVGPQYDVIRTVGCLVIHKRPSVVAARRVCCDTCLGTPCFRCALFGFEVLQDGILLEALSPDTSQAENPMPTAYALCRWVDATLGTVGSHKLKAPRQSLPSTSLLHKSANKV